MRVERFVPWRHVSPVFGVMVGIDDSKNRMVHVSVLVAAGEVVKFELHLLPVG